MPKNKKFKRRQKGGSPISENLAPQQKTMTAGSNKPTWGKYNHTIFLWVILMLSVAGLVWFLLSRSLITHRHSEAISYGLMAVSVVLSVFMLISVSVVYGDKNDSGFKGMLKKIFAIFIDGIPAWLILAQIGVLIGLFVKHADYIYLNDEKPGLFTVFNITSAILIFMQLYMWNSKVKEILRLAGTGEKPTNSYVNIGMMILLGILTGICISQLYVILEMLLVDP